jgi:hypothetical protein
MCRYRYKKIFKLFCAGGVLQVALLAQMHANKSYEKDSGDDGILRDLFPFRIDVSAVRLKAVQPRLTREEREKLEEKRKKRERKIREREEWLMQTEGPQPEAHG